MTICNIDPINIDPNIARYPPEEIMILNLQVNPYQDGKRIFVSIELTPFSDRPVIELSISDSEGINCGSATIVEPPFWKHELTMHVRSNDPSDREFTIEALLVYPDLTNLAKKRIEFILPISEMSSGENEKS